MPNWGQPDWCVDVPLWRGFSAAQGCGVPRLHVRRVDGGHRRLCALHKNATTTPAIRRAIRSSSEPVTVLAKRYGIAPRTVRRWRERECGEDRSHTIACRRPWAANGMAEGFNGCIAEVLRSHHTPTAAPIKRRNALLFPEVVCLGTSGAGVLGRTNALSRVVDQNSLQALGLCGPLSGHLPCRPARNRRAM